jgi:hypothetical protein
MAQDGVMAADGRLTDQIWAFSARATHVTQDIPRLPGSGQPLTAM